ncbi:MAG: oxygenase MpaB family protein [Ginsengibacter sp.]
MKKKQLHPRFQDAIHFKNYWENGNGKKMIEWSGAEVSLKDFDQYAPLYHKADELGDQVVNEFYAIKPYAEASKEMESYLRTGIPQHAVVPDSVCKLIEYSETLPAWINQKLLQLGAENCMRSGLSAFISLRDYTLLGGYYYAYLNKPLVFTGALKKGAMKRLSETLDFWINVSRYDAMKIHRKGYEYAVKTRLIHSYARLKLKQHYTGWDNETMGEPLNLWDMTATSNGFSLVYLHGLYKLGMDISKEEELGVFHLWKYIGYLLGIPPEILPDNKKEAVERFYLWTSIQPPADEDSVMLAQTLVQESLENPILKYTFQRKLLRYIHISSAEFLLDEEVKKALQIPKMPGARVFPKTVQLANQVAQKTLSRKTLVANGNKAQVSILNQYLDLIKGSNFHH